MQTKPPRADSQYLPDPSIAVPHHHIKKQFLSLPGSVKVFVPPSEHSSEDDRAAPQPEPIQLNGNQPEKPGASTGLIGVYKIGKNYAAQITIEGTQHYIGKFPTKEEAGVAYAQYIVGKSTGKGTDPSTPKKPKYRQHETLREAYAREKEWGENAPTWFNLKQLPGSDLGDVSTTDQDGLSSSTSSNHTPGIPGPPQPQVYLDGHPVQTIDDSMFTDNYLDSSHLPRDDTCHLCLESLQTTRPLISTACACKTALHLTCFHELIQYGYIVKTRDKKKLPSIIHKCGKCKQYNMGAFEEQDSYTSRAYNIFRRLPPEERRYDCDTTLPPIIHSTLQIIRSILRDWRGTTKPNIILSDLYYRLGCCYRTIMIMSKSRKKRNDAQPLAVMADINALRFHNKETTLLGVCTISWIHNVIVHQRRAGNIEFGKLHLPVVLDYLYALINNTTETDEDKAGTQPTATEERRLKHEMAQCHVVDILASDFASEMALCNELRGKFFEFVRQVRWEKIVVRDNDNTVENVLWPICCGHAMFEYIMKHVEWVGGNESLLEKMKRYFEDYILNGEAQVKIIEETMKRMEGQRCFGRRF